MQIGRIMYTRPIGSLTYTQPPALLIAVRTNWTSCGCAGLLVSWTHDPHFRANHVSNHVPLRSLTSHHRITIHIELRYEAHSLNAQAHYLPFAIVLKLK